MQSPVHSRSYIFNALLSAPANNSTSTQAQVHAAAVPGGTMPQLVPDPSSGVTHHGTGHYQNQMYGSPYANMASISYTQNPQRSHSAMPLAVRIAFFVAEYAQYSDMIGYYHQESAELERKRLDELLTATDFLASLSTNKTYDAQHHKLIDDLEGCFDQGTGSSNMANSHLGSASYSARNPGMQGNMFQQTSAAVTQLSASPDLQHQGQNAPRDVGAAQGFQTMPSMPHSANTPAPVSQNSAQDIYLGPLTKAQTDTREINELDTRILTHWYQKNYNFAYPLSQTTDILVQATGLQKWQVDKWFNNRRTRDKNTKKFPEITRERKERVKKGAAWLRQQDDQLKKDIIQIKAKYNKVRG